MCTKTKTVKFSDIKTPITKKGFRRNLKKYYFCHGNDLLVNGETISISNLNKLTDLYKYYSEPKITPLIKYEIDDVYNYIMSNPFRKITALGGISNAIIGFFDNDEFSKIYINKNDFLKNTTPEWMKIDNEIFREFLWKTLGDFSGYTFSN